MAGGQSNLKLSATLCCIGHGKVLHQLSQKGLRIIGNHRGSWKRALFEIFPKRKKVARDSLAENFLGSVRLHFISNLFNIKETVCQLEMLVCGLSGCLWVLCTIE